MVPRTMRPESPRTEPAAAAPRGSRWGRLLRLGVTAALLGLLLATLDLRALGQTLLSARPGPVLVLLAVMIAQRFLAAFRWWLLLRLNDPGFTPGAVARITFAADFAGQLLPGTLGVEVLRLVGASRRVGAAAALSSLLVDRLLSTAALAALVVGALAIAPSALRIDAPVAAASWVCLALVIAATGAILSPALRRRAQRLLPKPIAARLEHRLARVHTALDQYRSRPALLAFGGVLAVAFQLMRVLMYIIAAAALGVAAPALALVVCIPVVIFVSLLPISIGGFGVREAALVYLLGTVGVPAESAVAMSLLVFVVHTISKLPGAWFCAVAAPSTARAPGAPVTADAGVALAGAPNDPR